MVKRDPDAERITAAYHRAKAANPKLTQRQFAEKALPKLSGKKRKPSSGERYLRFLLKGERSGSELMERAEETLPGGRRDAFQVIVPDAEGNERSFDLTVEGGRSTLDIPLIEQQLRDDPSILAAKRDEWARRYALKGTDLRIDKFTVRRVRRHRKHALVLSKNRGPIGQPV